MYKLQGHSGPKDLPTDSTSARDRRRKSKKVLTFGGISYLFL